MTAFIQELKRLYPHEVQPEHVALVALLQPQIGADEARALIEQADPRRLFAQAVLNGVAPLIHARLGSLDLQDTLPTVVREAMAQRAVVLSAHSLFLTAELTRVLDKLRSLGIHALPFKGPMVGMEAYGDIGLRPFSDLDLYLARDEVMEAGDALASLGYMPMLPQTRRAKRAVLNGRYAYGLVRAAPVGLIKLELHWALSHSSFPYRESDRDLRARVRTMFIGNEACETFSAEDTFIFLCMHGAKHYWERLIWISDLAGLMGGPELDWDQINRRARANGSHRMLRLGLTLGEGLLDVSPPDGVMAEVRSDDRVRQLAARMARWILGGPRLKGAARHRFHIRLRERTRDRVPQVREAIRLTLSPSESDRAFVELPAALSFLYVFVRPLRVLAQRIAS